MQYVIISLAQTAGVILLAVLGVCLGRWFSRLRSRAWLLGYAVPLLLVGVIAALLWQPRMQLLPPFSWIMADRTEFAATALIWTTLLTTPLSRLQNRRERRAVVVFMILCTTWFSIMPFLLPAFLYHHLSGLKTTLNQDGVCIQSTDYNCGPAAAVTALRKIGIRAEEGELAVWSHTNYFSGTPTDSLCAAIRKGYAVPCRTLYFSSVNELKGKEPLVAVIKFGFLVDHYVAVLSVTDTEVTAGDPLIGWRTYTHGQFEEVWRKCAIVFEKDPAANSGQKDRLKDR
jgi:hypothetical protein